MVKKKTHDTRDSREERNDKTTDNKENNNSRNNGEEMGSENQTITNQGTQSVDIPEQQSPSYVKVGSEERFLEEKLAEMQDKYIRLSAEFDNYRKRTLREKIELSKYASENLLLKIIPVMDDFDRAVSHMETASDCASMKDGIDLIYSKFVDFLKQNGDERN